jgi:hypothetical protein
MIHRELINPNKNRVYFTLSKVSNVFLLFSGAMAVFSLFLAINIPNFPYPPSRGMRGNRELMLQRIFMKNLLFSMVITGTIGIFISMPITIVLGIRLKSLRSAYLKGELGANKDFILVKIPNLAHRSPRYIYYPY